MPRKTTLKGASILVADDHVDSADLLAMVLESAGADVRTGNTAAEVVDLVRSGQLGPGAPDLFLLDITLPDMDGYELLATLRGIDGCASVPAVAVTGHASERDKARSTEAGFAVHATKPFDNDALVLVLGELFAMHARKSETPPASGDASTTETARQRLAQGGVAVAPTQTELLLRLAPLVAGIDGARDSRRVQG